MLFFVCGVFPVIMYDYFYFPELPCYFWHSKIFHFFKARNSAGFRGTVRYASINAHENKVCVTFTAVINEEWKKGF